MRRRPRTFGTFAGVGVVTAAALAAPGASSASRPNPWLAYKTSVNPGSGIQFVSPSTLFALAGEPINALDRRLAAPAGLTITWPSSSVLVSRDGGRTWRVSLRASTGLWGLAFRNSREGLAVGVSALYRTWNSGTSWQQIAEPRQPLVRAVVRGSGAVGLTTRGRLVTSDDGGSSWPLSGWAGSGRALCLVGGRLLVADQHGGVWRSQPQDAPPFTKMAPGRPTPVKDGPCWVDLSCAKNNAVEFMQAAPEAAGGAVETIVRQTTDGGLTWRQLGLITNGAADETAPLPAQAVPVGAGAACLFSYPITPTLDIRCTSDGGRSFRHALAPRLPNAHLQGVDFLGPKLGWLEVVRSFVSGRRPPRYETQVWRTGDGGASWRVADASPLRRVLSRRSDSAGTQLATERVTMGSGAS